MALNKIEVPTGIAFEELAHGVADLLGKVAVLSAVSDHLVLELAQLATRVATLESLPPPVPPPFIDSFTATPISAEIGQSVALQWETTGAVQVLLITDSNAIEVLTNSRQDVIIVPGSPNVWTLSAKNAAGVTTTRDVAIAVVVHAFSPADPAPEAGEPPLSLVPIYDAPAHPFRVGLVWYATLQAALDALIDGDTLRISAGRYPDQAGIYRPNHSFTATLIDPESRS